MGKENGNKVSIQVPAGLMNYRMWDDITISKAPAARKYRKWASITVGSYFLMLASIILGLLIFIAHANLAGSNKFAIKNMEIVAFIFASLFVFWMYSVTKRDKYKKIYKERNDKKNL